MAQSLVVLIVEDDSAIRRALIDKFTVDGCKALGAENGQEGLDVATKEHPDAIVLDLLMPKMDGMSMLRQLREDSWGKDVPVLILTNSNSGGDVEEALKLGVYDFLVKADWRIEDVVERVRTRVRKQEE